MIPSDSGPSGPLLFAHRISVADLILLGVLRQRSRSKLTVWYDRAPLPLRALQRLFACPVDSSMRVVGRLMRIEFVQLRHELQVEDYPRVHADALEATYDVLAILIRDGLLAPGLGIVSGLLGEDAASSFVAKALAEQEVMPAVLGLETLGADPRVGPVSFWLPVGWPSTLGQLVAAGRSSDAGAVVEGSRPARAVMARLVGICRAGAMFLQLGWAVLRQGAWPRRRNRPRYLAAVEFLDQERSTGGLKDVESFLGDGRLGGNEVLIFVTPSQERVLRELGGRHWTGAVHRAARERGLHFVAIGELSYSLETLRAAVKLPARAALQAFRAPAAVSLVQRRFLSGFLGLVALFDHADIGALVYNTFPNGPGSFRTDSGLVTGLANRAGTLSVGLQTRSYYLRKWEDAFDCYDIFFFWGPRYRELIGEAGTRWLRRLEITGSSTLTSHLLESRSRHAGSPGASAPTVVAFTGDVHPPGAFYGHHYTYDYTARFLLALTQFARAHPDATVSVKLKDPLGARIYQGDPRFAELLVPGALPNFRFLSLARDVYADVLSAADVVAAMGFTSPGTDAILLRKPTLFYSELGATRQAFAWGTGIVTYSAADFVRRLTGIVNQPPIPTQEQDALAVSLDPFTDGQAYDRIVAVIRGVVASTGANTR